TSDRNREGSRNRVRFWAAEDRGRGSVCKATELATRSRRTHSASASRIVFATNCQRGSYSCDVHAVVVRGRSGEYGCGDGVVCNYVSAEDNAKRGSSGRRLCARG